MKQELASRLRLMRQEAGLSLEELSRRTRISASALRALEEGELEKLPAPVFVRGFVNSVCAELGHDPLPFAPLLEECLAPAAKEVEVEERETRRKGTPAALALLLLLLAGGGVYLGAGDGEDTHPSGETVVAESLPAPPPETGLDEEAGIYQPPTLPAWMDLVIVAIEQTWIRVQVDDTPPWESTMRPGDEVSFRAGERVTMKIGNAGGVVFELNGRRFGPPGAHGEVLSEYVLTRDNI